MAGFEVDVGGRTYEVDAPDPQTAWKWANQFHKDAEGKRQERVAADQAATQESFRKSEADRPLTERVAVNLGAGFDTAWQGAKQLGHMVGLGEGVSDEDLTESRRLKHEAAQTMPGGSLVQLAGEIAPTAVLPVGASGSLLKAALMGGAGGAAAGALQPVLSSESRLANTALGAAGGAAAPLAVAGVRKMLPLALGGGGALSAEQRAGKQLVKTLGEKDAATTAAKLSAPRTSAITGDIPLTTAEAAGDSRLARMELAARRNNPEIFSELGRRQNEAIYEAATKRAGVEGTDQFLNIAKNARDVVSDPLREKALQQASKFSHVAQPLERDTADILSRTAKGSPANRVASHVQSVLETNPNPTQLYDLRKDLVRRLSGPTAIGDDLSAAVKGADRETMTLVRAIDARLDEAAARKAGSQTPWSDYLQTYSKHSPPVTSARAQQQINEAIGAPGRPLVGDAPETTRHVLRQALDKFSKNKFGSRLTPGAESRYDELLGFLQAKEEPMRAMKLGGTGGGGSQTAMQSMIERVATGNPLSYKRQALDFVRGQFRDATREELTMMAADPARAAAGIQAALQSGKPLSGSQQAFLALARSSGAGAAGSLSQPAE